LQRIKEVSFNASNAAHMDLLESLWTNLRPETRRCVPKATTGLHSSNQLESDSWGEIGFQGTNPCTDFRGIINPSSKHLSFLARSIAGPTLTQSSGMGLLGLTQLAHFAKFHTKRARSCLAESINPDRAYFPFATAGINLTFFLMELAQEGRLANIILASLNKNSMNSPQTADGGPSESKELVCAAVLSVNDLYADLFVEFTDCWVKFSPKDLMDFPRIYGNFKGKIRHRMQVL
jgi:hypothetical protein